MADDTPPWFIKTTHTAPKPMSIHAFKMGNFKSMRFCGTPVDYNFLNAVRPDTSTGKCPNGYESCN